MGLFNGIGNPLNFPDFSDSDGVLSKSELKTVVDTGPTGEGKIPCVEQEYEGFFGDNLKARAGTTSPDGGKYSQTVISFSPGEYFRGMHVDVAGHLFQHCDQLSIYFDGQTELDGVLVAMKMMVRSLEKQLTQKREEYRRVGKRREVEEAVNIALQRALFVPVKRQMPTVVEPNMTLAQRMRIRKPTVVEGPPLLEGMIEKVVERVLATKKT